MIPDLLEHDVVPVVTDRERFTALLYTHPLLRADAVVVLCGEDIVPRTAMTVELWRNNAAEGLVLSGGKHAPPRWTGADEVRLKLLAASVAPDRILVESESTNTREQAVNVVAIAVEKQWKYLLVVASSYHMPRAFLTMLQAIDEAGVSETVRLIPAPAPARWSTSPDGMQATRAELFDVEAEKIGQYGEHVATYARGIAYLLAWESK